MEGTWASPVATMASGQGAMLLCALFFLSVFTQHEQQALIKKYSECRLEEVTDDARASLLVSRWEGVKHLVGEGSG